MERLLNALFPQGYRKLLVSLIALAIGVILEKFGGGLSDNMEQSLIAIVAIFVTGNVGAHLADALKVIKGTKIGQIVEDIIPGDQGLGKDVVATSASTGITNAATIAGKEATDPGSLSAIAKKLEDMDKNVQFLINGPEPEPIDPAAEIETISKKVSEIEAGQTNRITDLENKLAVQAQNLGQIVQILNQLRAPQQGAK